MNGYVHDPRGVRPGSAGGTYGSRDGRGSTEPIPHIKDLQTRVAQRLDDLRNAPVTRLLDEARNAFNSARFLMETRKGVATSYMDYLLAYELVLNDIPNSGEYIDKIKLSRSELHRQYEELKRDLRTYDRQIDNIKSIIVNDNKRNRASPSYLPRSSLSTNSQHSRQTSSPVPTYEHRYSTSDTARYNDELMLPDAPSSISNGKYTSAIISESPPRRPPVQPKPQSMHHRTVQSTSNGHSSGDELAERFARLSSPRSDARTSSTSSQFSVTMPLPEDYQTSDRPAGRRGMPPPPSHPPPHPPKLPLNTNIPTYMPKEPSPTYSPARNISMPPSINPPRSTARSMIGTGGRSNAQTLSSASSHAPYSNGDTESYFPGPGREGSSRRKSINKPKELQITAEKLYDYIRMYDVLLIDVRSREEFDSGHIYVRYIMCIEPAALQAGLSAEQLQDRLVLSPDDEQAMFERRNEYDLVVYYDESTKTHSFLDKYNPNEREVALKRVFDTLYEFNADKPLKRPPIFLMGGINAWTALVGGQALKMSSTAAGQVRPARGIARVPGATPASRLALHKRRMREYAPMDPEEERKFLEEARRGRAVLEQENGEVEGDDQDSTIFRSTEEFLRRYPEVDLEQQSMVYPPARPQIPSYTIPPPMSSAPSRPAPAVPRVSYSGVHERQITPHSRTNQTPIYVSQSRPGYIKLPHTGLINFGVTCYMNAVLQCLSGTTGLTTLFLSGRYCRDIQKDNWKGTRGLMSEAFATLLSNLWKNDVNSLRPTSFRKLCARLNSEWGVDQQQDAKEFLEFTLDLLHEDLNLTWSKPPLRELSSAEEQHREQLPRPYAAKVEWNRYTHREKSVIGDLFTGQHASRLTCNVCRTTSTTYEAFWSISVEIPHDRPADLRDCLRSYCAEEQLYGDDIWRCPRCKVDREAKKKITITRAPDFLVIHLKRFSASHTESARKVRTPIEFPLHGLDLGPFMLPPMDPVQEAYVLHNAHDGAAQLAGLKTDPAMNGPYVYNAYAVIRHLGSTLGSGHYVALVKDKSRGCWRQFNDERVSDFEPGNLAPGDRLQNEKAYIVFYERERVAGGVF